MVCIETNLQDLLVVLGLGLLNFGRDRDIVLEISTHMLPCSQTLQQELGSLCRDRPVSLQCLSLRGILFLHHSGPSSRNLFLLGYRVHTSLLSVSGMASSSETDVARVKLLLTVAERWGSLCSTGLTGVDMSAGMLSNAEVRERGRRVAVNGRPNVAT